jgi:hypothetical protein
MRNQLAIVILIFGAVQHAPAYAAPKMYLCPQSIPETSIRLVALEKEWKPFVSSPLYLSGAAPADGPPERLGILRESGSSKTKTGWTHKYTLDARYPEGKWLRCDYGFFGEASLAKRLPNEVRECTVTGKKGKHSGENQIEVRCQ